MILATFASSTLWSTVTLGYAALTLCLILLVKTLVKPYMSGNIPPFPARPYPILGHLPYFANGQRQKLLEFRKTTGDIFSMFFGSQLFVVVNGPRLVKEVLVKHPDTMNSRPPQPFVDQGDYGVVFSNGAMWKEQRSVSQAILRSFGMGKSSLSHKISEEIGIYLDTLAALDGKPKDVRTLTAASISNVICSIMVGKRFDYDDPLFKSFVENFTRQIAAFDNMSVVAIWPWLRYIPGNFLGAKTVNMCAQIIRQEFGDKFIELALKEDGEDAAPTFITSYIKEMKKAQKQGNDTTLSMEQLRINLQQLFIAGTDTTATTLTWFLVYMLNYPKIQSKMYEEICSVMGPERAPDMQDKVKLPYTNAVIMETQRLASIAPQRYAKH
ncbi:hypothetical protein RRG08_050729 [Elysia crispata]|uniref:Cytochrome P450 n=1 Tax=Elysia crispata TaxID=231223 RepID=A0AAE0ZSM1_9GAST|nr:hypothetical protein RRG08_050729 [Elysia crispata]